QYPALRAICNSLLPAGDACGWFGCRITKPATVFIIEFQSMSIWMHHCYKLICSFVVKHLFHRMNADERR
ncbi:MAG TPA: hypothetical protein PK125_05005, partial [Syntrophorhabdus sp.]|nr:hypothetical protein [Syntrophorhabdus sp.]